MWSTCQGRLGKGQLGPHNRWLGAHGVVRDAGSTGTECLCYLKMEAVAEAAGNFARVVPVGSAEGVGAVDLVARIGDVLRGEIYGEVFAEGFSERQRKLGVVAKMLRAIAVEEAGTVAEISGDECAPGK